jgi:REP element-mobilizing transposase RayT
MHLITRYPTRRGIITTVNLVALDQWLAEDARLIQAEIDQWVADGNDVVTAEEVA